jgi:hypothetical protein
MPSIKDKLKGYLGRDTPAADEKLNERAKQEVARTSDRASSLSAQRQPATHKVPAEKLQALGQKVNAQEVRNVVRDTADIKTNPVDRSEGRSNSENARHQGKTVIDNGMTTNEELPNQETRDRVNNYLDQDKAPKQPADEREQEDEREA